MEQPGNRLKRVREKLGLTYRDVEHLSHEIAGRRGNTDFSIALSRLADIENKGTLPSIYRLYTLCAIYRLEFSDVLAWYGVPADDFATDALQTRLDRTHALRFKPDLPANNGELPKPLDRLHSVPLGPLTQARKHPLSLLGGFDHRRHCFGLVGSEDWSMYPILQPGALLIIDETRNKIARGGWTDELDRPIYFLEHRQGYLCGWCSMEANRLMVLSHPASPEPPRIFSHPNDVDVLGQVVAVANLLDTRKRRPDRSPARS
jgi:transcriptional regulator with XRE-family HTH domain